MLAGATIESPTGHSLVAELDAAGLFAYPTERNGVTLSPMEEVTDAIRARMKPHKAILSAYLTERMAIEQTFPASWADAAAQAEPDACPAHIEARGFCYRRPEILDGARIIVAKNDCALCPYYMGATVYYEAELPTLVQMAQDNALRLQFDKGRVFTAWSATGWWSEVHKDRVSFLARAGGIPESAVQNLLGYLAGLGIVEQKNEGGPVWRLVPADRRARAQKGQN